MESTAIGAAGPFLISGILACALSAAILTRRVSPVTLFLSLGTFAIGMWSLMSGFHLLSDDLAVKTAWVHGKYVFTSATPVLWFLTALAYAGSPLVRRSSFLAGIALYPVVTVALVATNARHGLMFTSIFPVETSRFTTIGHTYGAAFWTYAFVGYAMILAGVAVLGRTAVRRQGYVRRQSIMMTVAAIVPIVFSVWFLTNPSGKNHLDYTPVSFVVTNAAFAVAIFRYRMLSLMPVARREVIRLMDASVIVTDADGYIEGLNPAARRVASGSFGRTIGRPISECVPELADVFESTRASGHCDSEVRLGTDRDAGWYAATGKAFEEGPGHPPGLVFVLHDVSDLHEARERAEELSRLKSTFLSNMSHEIRTPLSAIIGVSDMLLESTTDQDREMIGLIRESGERLLRMLNSVLSVSSLQSGTILHRPESVELVEIVRKVVSEYGEQAADALIEVETDLPEEPVNARIDPLHLAHVLSHLLDNAIRYTESGSVGVRFEATSDDVVLTVRDTGGGIPESFLPVLGTPFQQAESGDTRPVEGAGLGLAVVWGLVEVMGGSVSFDSTPSRGTTFRIVLPRWEGQRVVDSAVEMSETEVYAPATSARPVDPVPARTSRESIPSRRSSIPSNGSAIRSR